MARAIVVKMEPWWDQTGGKWGFEAHVEFFGSGGVRSANDLGTVQLAPDDTETPAQFQARFVGLIKAQGVAKGYTMGASSVYFPSFSLV
jgi:hypothetical protein